MEAINQCGFQDPKMEVLYHIRPVRAFHFFGLTCFSDVFEFFFGLFLNLLDFVWHVLEHSGFFGMFWNFLDVFGMFCHFSECFVFFLECYTNVLECSDKPKWLRQQWKISNVLGFV
jgi:hypothetical protein